MIFLGGDNSNSFLFSPRNLGKMFTHFDLRIFFRWVGSTMNQFCEHFLFLVLHVCVSLGTIGAVRSSFDRGAFLVFFWKGSWDAKDRLTLDFFL